MSNIDAQVPIPYYFSSYVEDFSSKTNYCIRMIGSYHEKKTPSLTLFIARCMTRFNKLMHIGDSDYLLD